LLSAADARAGFKRQYLCDQRNTVSLAGTVSDNVGVVSVTWTNDRGGRGAATFGTSSWSVSSIDLKNGPNLLTVTAADAAGNTASAMLTVTSKVTGKK
jgi:hypothetical protein